jgi:uncharacterized membrane protein
MAQLSKGSQGAGLGLTGYALVVAGLALTFSSLAFFIATAAHLIKGVPPLSVEIIGAVIGILGVGRMASAYVAAMKEGDLPLASLARIVAIAAGINLGIAIYTDVGNPDI